MECSPESSDAGSAVSVQTGAFVTGGVSVTVTVASQCAVPPLPVTVPVYFVVAVGDTEIAPLTIGVTEPIF